MAEAHRVLCRWYLEQSPYEDETAEHPANPTNVYKLFLCLAGSLSLNSLLNSNEQEKALMKMVRRRSSRNTFMASEIRAIS